MSSSDSCPECGKPLPEGHALCPSCLLAQAMASRTVVDPEAAPVDHRAAAPEPEEIADKFPQFQILECLGRGGMGVVYKARQKSLNRIVAIKILAPAAGVEEPRFATRFATEAELLAKLSHPNIVTIHDFGETGGLYYLVMEYIGGVNLRDLLREGKMPPEEALAIVPPVCEALQYAHERGIVHRDIKPENILLDRDGRVKIADFGIAVLTGAAADQAGTPAYMAPEQRTASKIVDHRTDIYALGAVLYEMLTGDRPGSWPPAPSRRVRIDVRLDEVVLRALEAEPGRRYQSAGEFQTIVETVAAGEEFPAMPRPLAAGQVKIEVPQAVKNVDAPAAPPAARPPGEGVDYRSVQTLLGWPLLHIASGVDPATGKRRCARGWLAVGDHATGFLAIGGVARGALAFGGVAIGGLAFGGVGLGVVAIGGLGVALLAAFAGLAMAGFVAIGGAAIGYNAYGGLPFGMNVLGPGMGQVDGIDFFMPWANRLLAKFILWYPIPIVLAIGLQAGLLRWAAAKTRGLQAGAPPPSSPAGPSRSNGSHVWKSILHFAPALLLIVAWLTSGLERGAVLILSIVVVAVLVVRFIHLPVARSDAKDDGEEEHDATVLRAIGRQLFLFAPVLLMALLWNRYDFRTGTTYALIAVLQAILLARIYPRVPFRRWIPGLLIMGLLAMAPYLYDRRLWTVPFYDPVPVSEGQSD